jgi:hypothetical protein
VARFQRKVLRVRNISTFLLIALCASSIGQNVNRPRAETRAWVLRYDGIGDVNVGMTLKEVSSALGAHFSEPKDKDERTCFYIEPKQHPDTAIMVLNGRVACGRLCAR